jgi:hypothetical protein
VTPETRTTPLPEFALSTPATATVLGDREESRTPGLGVSRQFLRVVGVGRRRYLPPVGATAPPGTTPYGSIRGVCGLIVDRAIRGSALESSDRCNCKVFGAREENRTPDLLITSHPRRVVRARRAWYLAGFRVFKSSGTTSYRVIRRSLWPISGPLPKQRGPHLHPPVTRPGGPKAGRPPIDRPRTPAFSHPPRQQDPQLPVPLGHWKIMEV